MIMEKILWVFFLIIAVFFSLSAGSPFTAGNIVVVRVGDGSASLTGNSTAVFLDEYTTGGLLVQSIAIPTSSSGSNAPLTLSGTASSEGSIVPSVDGRYLTIAGYGVAPGTASIAGTASSTVNRVVARIDANASIDITTKLSDASTGNNIRGAVTNDGTAFWVSGAAGGVRYSALGATTSTQLSTTITNSRVINIFNSQLYVSSAKGTFYGISSIGSGLPTTSGQAIALLSGFPTSGNASPFGFSLNGNTVYVADDETNGSGGVQKWTYSGSVWSLAYLLAPSSSTGAIGLLVDWTSPNPIIYATTTDNKIVTVTDAGSSSSFTTLVTGAANTLLHGVSFTPTPLITFTNGTSFIAPTGIPNTNDNPIGRFKLAGNITGGKLTQVDVTLSGTYSGITNLKLYYSLDTTFSVGTSTLLAAAASPSSSVTFNISSTPQPIPTSGGYFYIAADLNSSASGAAIASLANQTVFSFTNASINGSFINAMLSSVYSLMVNSSHGTVTKTPDQQNYPSGASVQLKANPDSSYHFVTWTGDVPSGHETDTPLTVTMNQNRIIAAYFALNTSSPILILPTVTNIVSTTALLGAKVVSNGNDSITERGVVWSTSANPTTADNKVIASDTNSTYTVAVSSLPAGTLIHFRGYAINAIGTGYSSDATFYTLSLEPSTSTDMLIAAPVSSGQIHLSWSAASGATGYIILQRTGSDPTGLPMDATSYAVGDTIGDGIVAAFITSGATTSAAIIGLTAATSYHYSILPYAWDGSHPGTYNYRTNGTIPAAHAVTLMGPQLTAVILPKYIEGVNGTNSNRIPFAYRARLTGLLADSTYRFYNQVVISSDTITANGAGNCIFASATGDFVRGGNPSLATTGNYGTLIADGTGVYEGWFITEPTGNKRFVPGKYIFMRMTLNDGAGGTTVALLLTTADSVRVVKLDPAPSDSTGTGLRCTSAANPKDFVFAYDDTAGTGRPVSGSFVESDGTDNSTVNNYAAFYSNSVNGISGAFGMVLPNMLSNGVRRIEQRSLANDSVVAVATDANGIWPSGTNTVNPSGGTTEIILTALDLHETGVRGMGTIPEEFALMQNYPNPFNPSTKITFTLKSNSTVRLSVYDILGREAAILVNNERKPAGRYEVLFTSTNLSSGIYFYRLQTENFVKTNKMVVIK